MADNFPIRRRRTESVDHQIVQPTPSRPAGVGIRYIVVGFGAILAAGWLLLMLPVAAADGHATNPFDAFFTAVSAISVTGLVVVETQEHWSLFGEAVILILIQIGGLGYMAGSAFVLWIFGRRLGLRGQHALRQYYGAPSMQETAGFVRMIASFALAIEAAGIAALWVAFVVAGEPPGRSIWWAIFHALSAFNNAGFSITGADLTPFREDAGVLLVVTALVIAGGIGALPIIALAGQRSFRRLSLDFKLIFIATAVLLVAGAVTIGAAEWTNDGSLGAIDPGHRPLVAFFESAMLRTAGFSAFDVGAEHDETLFVEIGLMLVGGATGSTAGGMKVGTVAIFVVVLLAAVRGRSEPVAFGRIIPRMVIYRAVAIATLYLGAVFLLAASLAALNTFDFVSIFFEASSALGTVGLSTGITAELGPASRALLIVGMLTGRFGPLLLVLYFTRPLQAAQYRVPEEGIRLG